MEMWTKRLKKWKISMENYYNIYICLENKLYVVLSNQNAPLRSGTFHLNLASCNEPKELIENRRK